MRRSLLSAAVAGVVALAGTVLISGTAHAVSNLTCRGGFSNPATGTYDNVTVPGTASGSNFCFLKGAHVLGKVGVRRGGAVLIANTSIAGTIKSSGAGTATGGSGLTFSVVMCGSTVGDDVSVTGSPSLVEIGTDDFTVCAEPGNPVPNTLNGVTNDVSANQGGVEVESNNVNGDLSVDNNSGFIPSNRDPDAAPGETTAVNNNSDSTHTLTCVGNAPTVSSTGNTFQSIVGQCS